MGIKRKTVIFSAMSLDGFIAKPNGDIDWLFDIPNLDKTDHGYSSFYQKIDTTIIGRKTYEKIINRRDQFPYPDKKNYVFSKTLNESTKYVDFISDDIIQFIKKIKQSPGKDIWIVGGGEINSVLLENDLVDKLQIQVFPILLNKGIPLSSCNLSEIRLKYMSTEVFPSGVVDMIYEKKL